jgi:WhiB family redox-sensing transcriptional regulator
VGRTGRNPAHRRRQRVLPEADLSALHKKTLVLHKKIVRIPSTLARFAPKNTVKWETSGGTGGSGISNDRDDAAAEYQGGRMGTDWMSQGKCRELSPSFFFPSDGIGVQEAQRVCAECPVAEACLQYALDERVDHGVWGGKSERERRRILRRRRLSHAARV